MQDPIIRKLIDANLVVQLIQQAAQQHREHYRDRTETVPPVRIFILPKISHDTKCHKIPA